MDQIKLDNKKSHLIKLRAIIAGDYERTVETSSEEFGKGVPDMNDEASRTMSRRILLEIGNQSHDILEKIDEALERIEEGQYGICEECEEDIPEKRLELLPYASYCVECQEKIETKIQEAD